MPITLQVGPGELIDKLTILEVKAQRMDDPAKVENVRRELGMLRDVAEREVPARPNIAMLRGQLKAVNETLWEIEDAIREHERKKDFGPRFIELARAVYQNNDRRAQIKRQINHELGSELVEEKSYAAY